MSKMKRLASLLLALALVLALGVSAFADGYTITIKNSTSGYTYTAYQIFAGDLSTNDSGGLVLSNITWGSNVNTADENAIYTALAKISTTVDGEIVYPFKDCTSAADVAEVLANYSDDDAVVQAFAAAIKSFITGTGTVSTADMTGEGDDATFAGTYTISSLPAGYYLVESTTVPTDGAYTRYILTVVGDAEVNTKSDVPGFDKTVGNSTDNDLANTDDATEDYAVGDSVPFTLTATLPSNYGDYDSYKLVFTDTLSSGLTYDANSLTVTVVSADGTETIATLTANTDYTVTTSEDGQTITVTINDLKPAAAAAVAVIKVIVSYKATLDDADSSIESNSATLTYDNNPNGSGTGTSTTDKTYVVTFEVDVEKTDGSGNALEGAGFTLYKQVTVTESDFSADGAKYYTISGTTATLATSYDSDETYYVAVSTLTAGTTYQSVGTEVEAFESDVTYYIYDSESATYTEVTTTEPTSGTEYFVQVQNAFSIDGLDVGTYALVETTTPTGYNTADAIIFTIDAEATESSTGVEVETKSITNFTISSDGTTLSTTVKNQAGSSLPSTGGIGTTIFYVIGSIMVLGAVVLLITRKRMSKAE